MTDATGVLGLTYGERLETKIWVTILRIHQFSGPATAMIDESFRSGSNSLNGGSGGDFGGRRGYFPMGHTTSMT